MVVTLLTAQQQQQIAALQATVVSARKAQVSASAALQSALLVILGVRSPIGVQVSDDGLYIISPTQPSPASIQPVQSVSASVSTPVSAVKPA
jgi:hypothetical protein